METITRFVTDFFTERVWVTILLVGVVLVLVSYFWLAARAIKASKWWLPGLIPPIALLYLLSFSRRVIAPLILFLIGAAVVATPYVATHYLMPLLPRHPWERNVGDELHVTFTGVTDPKYPSLKGRTQIAVLQMANPDVTDETLDFLVGMNDLHELDLNSSQITDAGLAKLRSLPKLKTLRLAHVEKITDDGFNQSIAPIDRIVDLDLRNTKVSADSRKKWQDAVPGRTVLPKVWSKAAPKAP